MRRALAIAIVLVAACEGVPYPVLFVATDLGNVALCCDPADGLPLVVEEFDVYSTGPADGSIDPTTYEVQLFYTSTSEAVMLSEPSGGSIPFGTATLAILVDSCEFEEALLDIDIELSVERTDGTVLQTGWIGTIAVTNTCP